MLDKVAQRKEIRKCLRSLPLDELSKQSLKIMRAVVNLECFHNCRSLSVYLPMKREVDTKFAIRTAFQVLDMPLVCIPHIIGDASEDMRFLKLNSFEEINTLPLNKWGIPEYDHSIYVSKKDDIDKTSSLFDVVIVPGMAFSCRGERLGHGRGYYDAFLTSLKTRRQHAGLSDPVLIGVGFDEQIIDNVPTDEHDVLLDYIISGSHVFSVKDKRQWTH